MIRKSLLPVLALAGVLFAIYTVAHGNKPVPIAPPAALPAQPPFASYVAGAGLVEASTENIAIGTHVAGVVTHVSVTPGSRVKRGDALFAIDDRQVSALIAARTAAIAAAKASLAKLLALPRAEDVPSAEARVLEAEATLADLQSQVTMWQSVQDKRAVNEDALSQRRFAARVAEAKLAGERAQLALLKAGAWQPDVEIANSQVATAEAELNAAQIDRERLTVRAPTDAQVLQVKVRAGEFASTGVLQTPLVLLGNLDRLHVRVDVDENDAWRVRAGAPAVAFVRGNRELKTDLKFERIEPYVIPKRSLTGDTNERVDTRVLQVLYSFARDSMPVYVGQQMDVFIDAQAAGTP